MHDGGGHGGYHYSSDDDSCDTEADDVVDENEYYIHTDESTRRRQYTKEVLGSITDEDVESLFLQSLQMGPEQTAVYSREIARSVANCCPHGCCEEQILYAKTEKLIRMEASAKEAVAEAFTELEEARRRAALAQEMRAEKQDQYRKSSVLWSDESSIDLSRRETSPKKSSKTMESRIYQRGHSTLSSSKKGSSPGDGQSATGLRSRIGSVDSINTRESLTPPSSGRSPQQTFELERQDSSESFKSAASHIEPSESSKHAKFAENDDALVSMPEIPKPRALHHEWQDSSSYKPTSILKPTSWASSMALEIEDAKSTAEKDSSEHALSKTIEPWEIVELVATEAESSASRTGILKRDHRVDDGVWHRPTWKLFRRRFKKKVRNILSWGISATGEVTDVQARDSTFAVVTFTSRQAAIAARNCLSDGRGAGRWRTLEEIPTPPLADASAFNICDCRGCMR